MRTSVSLDDKLAAEARELGINGDGLHTVSQRRLTRRIGSIEDDVLTEVCSAMAVALGCDEY